MELSPEQIKKVQEISEDFYRYTLNNLWIRNKDGEIVKLNFNQAQKALVDRVLQLIDEGKPIRIIILKARQMGLSTAIEALIYWWTTTHSNITAMIIGHEDESSGNLYNMFKRYYDNSLPIFKPTRKYNTRRDLVFSKEDPVTGQQKGLNSIIKTATAKNVSAGRSDTIQLIHGSEIGEWSNGEELVASLLQTVPVRKNTMIFLESTANGRGNFFYRQWQKTVKGETVFEAFFFPWWLHDEYEMEGEIDEYTAEEQDIIEIMRAGIMIGDKLFNVPEEKMMPKIAFRRYKEREFAATPEKLYQEYPSTAHEAFIASGNPVFDVKALSYMEKQCEKHEYTLCDIRETEERSIVLEQGNEYSNLKVWDFPEEDVDYVIGADVAEGIKGGDYSVADIIRTSDMKTVARYRGQPDPDQFGHILERLGRVYNYALIGVEINNHGLAVVQRLRDLFYRNLYRREKGTDELFEESTAKLGWKTTSITKPMMIDYLQEAIREGSVKDYDIVFVEEAFSYVRDDSGRTNAEEGSFDDTVMAKAIALQMFDWSNNNKASLRAHKPSKMVSRKRSNKVIR